MTQVRNDGEKNENCEFVNKIPNTIQLKRVEKEKKKTIFIFFLWKMN